MNFNQPGPGQVRITEEMARQSKPLVCPKCGGLYFQPVLAFREISKIVAQSEKDLLVPFQLFKCDTCEFVTEELMSEEDFKALVNEEDKTESE